MSKDEILKEKEEIDFKRAKSLYKKIKDDKEIFEGMVPDLKPILFVLCLIYVRLESLCKEVNE